MPIHFLPPWCRPFCSARRSRSASTSFFPAAQRGPRSPAFSSAVRNRSASALSHSSGSSVFGSLRRFDALEAVAEHPVEPVEMPLVLNEGRAGQVIELVDIERRDPLLHRLQQRQKLAQRCWNLRLPQFEEERDENIEGVGYECQGYFQGSRLYKLSRIDFLRPVGDEGIKVQIEAAFGEKTAVLIGRATAEQQLPQRAQVMGGCHHRRVVHSHPVAV